jgi:hypoxanthine phosphoribosyltransferase
MAEKRLYTWLELALDCAELADRVRALKTEDAWEPQCILAIARGGLAPAALLANHLGLRRVVTASVLSYRGDKQQRRCRIVPPFPLGPDEREGKLRDVLIVDDVCDSGRSLHVVQRRLQVCGFYYRSVTLHYKPGAIVVPSLYMHCTKDWIVYPWETGE